jgi:hypothetical protein
MPRRTQVGSVKNEVRPAAYATAPSSPSRNLQVSGFPAWMMARWARGLLGPSAASTAPMRTTAPSVISTSCAMSPVVWSCCGARAAVRFYEFDDLGRETGSSDR